MQRTNRLTVVTAGLAVVSCVLAAADAWAQPQHAPPERLAGQAALDALGGPTLVTLHLKDARPLEVLESLAQQAGMRLSSSAVKDALDKSTPITVAVDQQPFWVVARELFARLNLHGTLREIFNVDTLASGLELTLEPGRDPTLHGPGQQSGPFVVIASRVARSTYLDEQGRPPAHRQGIVELTVLVDPKLRIRGQPRGSRLAVTDDQGRSLQPVSDNYSWAHEVATRCPLVWRVRAVVDLPDQGVQRLGKVAGELDGFIATAQSEVWEVPQLLSARSPEKKLGGATFAVVNVHKAERDVQVNAVPSREVRYTVTLRSWGKGEETDFGWPQRSLHDRVSSARLADDQSRPFFRDDWDVQKGTWVIHFSRFEKRTGQPVQDSPVTLRWALPAAVINFQVPFEFQNITLP